MNFQQLIFILWSRKKTALLALGATVLTTLVVSLMQPKEYVSTATLVIDQNQVDLVTGSSLPVQLVAGYMATQVDVIFSHNVAKKVVEKLNLVDDPIMQKKFLASNSQGHVIDWIADYIVEDLEVLPSRESSLINISFTASANQLAADIANAFAETYIQTNIDLRAQPAKQSVAWFDNQKNVLRHRLEEAQSRLSNYQREYGIISVDNSFDLENSKLLDLSRQLLENQANASELQSRLDQIIDSKDRSYKSLHEVLSNELIQSLKSDLARSESKFADLSKRLGENHPKYKQSRAEILSLKRKINFEVKMIIDSISSRYNASSQRDKILVDALSAQKIKVFELKKQRDGIAVLSREVESVQQAFEGVMQKSIQTLMSSEISQSNVAILNLAIPAHKHTKPRVLLNVILAIFLGTILGLGAAIFVELLDRRVRSTFDITGSLSIPLFGDVSKHFY